MSPDPRETRRAAVVSAAVALREDRLAGGIALLTAAAYGITFSKATLVADGAIEAEVFDLVGQQAHVGSGSGKHAAGALLAALQPLVDEAGKRAKLKLLSGGRR